MKIGYVGLGKMGHNMVLRLLEKGHQVVGYNRSPESTKETEKAGVIGTYSIEEFVKKMPSNKIIWITVPQGTPVDDVISSLLPHLKKGDILIDCGNSYFKDSIRRSKELKKKGIYFLDIGVSGGPGGARHGASMMIGGEKQIFQKLESLFKDLCVPEGYGYMGKSGAGHFVKMVHNGIEYGMMQAIAEGFEVMKKSEFNLNLTKVAEVYNHGTVIESRLVGWLKKAYEQFGEDLESISGSVEHTGMGEWTSNTAKELGVPVPIIKGAFDFRVNSSKNPSYSGKVLSALRNQFGGHGATKKNA